MCEMMKILQNRPKTRFMYIFAVDLPEARMKSIEDETRKRQ
jgi:hypothetical protein